MNEWNDSWPVALGAAGFVEYPPAACRPLCFDGTTSRGFGRDGKNVITWGSPAQCPGTPADAFATACLWYEEDKPASHRLDEVDILLNPSLTDRVWAIPDFLAEAHGEAMFWNQRLDEAICRGPSYPGRPAMPSRWQDLQSALTHELGHALGLDHFGDWPSDLLDADAARQTMFAKGFSCLTLMHTLAEGDLVALQRVAARSLDD